MNYRIYYSNELYHYGVKGMKWGVRKEYVPKGRDKASGGYSAEKKRRKLTNKQKKIIGIAAGTVALAATGYVLYKTGQFDRLANVGRSIASKQIDVKGLDAKKAFELSESNIQQCAANINPTGSKTNCGSCATAALQNMMGGNYQALSEVPEHMRIAGGQGYDPDKLISCFQGGKWDTVMNGNSRREVSNKLETAILAHGEGSKGIFYPEKIRGRSTGHYFTWTVMNGKVNVVEGQPVKEGIVWNKNFYDDVGQLFNNMYDVKVARLDNCPIKPDRLGDVVKKWSGV